MIPPARHPLNSATPSTVSASTRTVFVYVCDRANNRMQVFRKDGTFVLEHIYEKMTRGSGSVFDLVFSPDRDQKFIYMVDGAALSSALRKRRSAASAVPDGRLASSRSCTTSPSTAKETFSPRR